MNLKRETTMLVNYWAKRYNNYIGGVMAKKSFNALARRIEKRQQKQFKQLYNKSECKEVSVDDALNTPRCKPCASRKQLLYNECMNAYGFARKDSVSKLIMGPQEFVKRDNAKEFEDSEIADYWVDDTQDSYVIVAKREKNRVCDDYRHPIPAGIYKTILDPKDNLYLQPFTFKKDQYYSLTTLDTGLIDDITYFLNNNAKYAACKLAHKRGILLFGPPGNGKTMVIEHISELFQNQVRTVFMDRHHMFSFLNSDFAEALSDMPVILILEEITGMMTSHSEVSLLLSFLDGDKSWDNILTIATTNYPEKLPANFVDRPSRFDRLYKVDCPNEKVRETYLTKLLKKKVHPAIIKKTDGYSLAYLKELIVESKIYKRTISETLKDFEERKMLIKHGFEKTGNIGFDTSEEIHEDQSRRSIGFGADDYDDETCPEEDDD